MNDSASYIQAKKAMLWEFMEIRKFFVIAMFSMMISSSCIFNRKDDRHLCIDFYKLNQSKDMAMFYDVIIGKGRVKMEYNSSSKLYKMKFTDIWIFDSKSQEYVVGPLLKNGMSSKDKRDAFAKSSTPFKVFLPQKSKTNNYDTLSTICSNYIHDLIQNHHILKIPKANGVENIIVEGNSRAGKFITFYLGKNCKDYYFASPKNHSLYEKQLMETSRAIDKHWHYQISL